jgi:hypothetical protein
MNGGGNECLWSKTSLAMIASRSFERRSPCELGVPLPPSHPLSVFRVAVLRCRGVVKRLTGKVKERFLLLAAVEANTQYMSAKEGGHNA